MRSSRSGSTYTTAAGTVVNRRAHLWTPPKQNHGEERKGYKKNEKQRRKVQQITRIRDALRVIEHQEGDRFLIKIGENFAKVISRYSLQDNYHKFNDYMESLARWDSMPPTPLNVWRKYNQASRFRINLGVNDFPTREIKRALRRADTENLLDARHGLALEMVDLSHQILDDDPIWDLETSSRLIDAQRSFDFVTLEIQRRATHGDEQALHFMQTLPDYRWELIHMEKEQYGKSFLHADKILTTEEVLNYVGCAAEELAVYVWTDMIAPQTHFSAKKHDANDLHAMTFEGQAVMQLKDMYGDKTA
jgi:hypothetical protein